MRFHILDTEAAYRRLLNAPDAEARTAIFQDELVEPFHGLVQIFGGDGLRAFAGWGMSPEMFAEAERAYMTAVLDALAQADAWKRAAASLEVGWAAFAPYADRVRTENITFGLMLAKLPDLDGVGGYTGFGAMPGWIMTVYGEPSAYNLERIEACTVHELHHNLAAAAEGTGMSKNFMTETTVADYMVSEGLAESFAAELYGEDKIGPWVTAFDTSKLAQSKAIMREGLHKTGFDVIRRYIFGDLTYGQQEFSGLGLPPYAGYALGYHTVQAYLKRTGTRVADATFVPPMELIAESGYLEA